MRAAGISGQETVREDVGVAPEQFGEEGDVRTAGAGEPGTDFLLSDFLHPTPAPTYLSLALWYN